MRHGAGIVHRDVDFEVIAAITGVDAAHFVDNAWCISIRRRRAGPSYRTARSPIADGPDRAVRQSAGAFLSVAGGSIRAMDAQPVVGDGQRPIAASFNDYFATFGIAIAPEDVVIGNRRTIRHVVAG